MKIFILLAFLFAFTSAEWHLKSQREVQEIIANCEKDTPKGPEEKTKTKELSPQAMQEILCNIRGFGLWDDQKGFMIDRAMIGFEESAKERNLDRKEFRKNMERCVDDNSQGSPPFEWAYRNFKCFYANVDVWKNFNNVKFYSEELERKRKEDKSTINIDE